MVAAAGEGTRVEVEDYLKAITLKPGFPFPKKGFSFHNRPDSKSEGEDANWKMITTKESINAIVGPIDGELEVFVLDLQKVH